MSEWFTSSFSSGGACVEVGYATAAGCSGGSCIEVGYVTSSACTNATACVEVGPGGGLVHVRDTKDRTGGTLTFQQTAWDEFVAAVTTGELGP